MFLAPESRIQEPESRILDSEFCILDSSSIAPSPEGAPIYDMPAPEIVYNIPR
jgi:hypothetical protein